MADLLSTPLQYVKGVGPRRAADSSASGCSPSKISCSDFRFATRIARAAARGALRPGRTATVVADVVSSGVRPTRRPGFRLFELVVQDATGRVKAVFPNQAFLRDVFHAGQHVVLFGALEFWSSGGLQFTNPEYEIIRGESDDDDATVHTGRIVPIYEKAGR